MNLQFSIGYKYFLYCREDVWKLTVFTDWGG